MKSPLVVRNIMWRLLQCVMLAVCVPAAFAQSTTPAATVSAKNAIESVQATQSAGNIVIKVVLKEPFNGQVPSFSVSNPARVALDFPGTSNATGQNSLAFNEGDLRGVNLVQVADRTRVVLNLLRPMSYTTQNSGREVLVTLAQGQARGQDSAQTGSRFLEENPVAGAEAHRIKDIAFRRGRDGEGRIVIDMSDSNTGIDIRQQGNNLLIDFLKTSLPDRLRRKMDVTDFGTPVNSVVTSSQGSIVRMVVTPKGIWEHNAYQTDNQFIIEVKALKEDPNKLVQGNRGQKYSGEKLSLNFQNIDVRSVLQVIADFTNFNIITSDGVSGNLTLRLKDVPWDQALDIILQAKGLDMRRNGSVIWIAPRDELAAKEKLELDSRAQVLELEPLRTETFQVNYHSAKSIFDGVLKDSPTGGGKTILSKRGSVVMDERSNKLIVSETASKLDEVRRMLQEIDVPVKQVIIEAQIVEATDSFARNLGFRLGVHNMNPAGRYSVGGSLNDTGFHTGQIATAPPFNDSLASANAAPPINGKVPGLLSLVLWNSSITRFLNMEISALEQDSRGKIVSRPRVMTADQNEAIIEQGVEIPYQSCASGAGGVVCTVSFRKAVLSLKVRPHITPDGRVSMKVDVNKDAVSDFTNNSQVAIDTKHVSTDVLVEDGGTVVLGGIYQQDVRNLVTKIPLLGDIPILGFLFRENERSDRKSELMIFITPRILKDQVASR